MDYLLKIFVQAFIYITDMRILTENEIRSLSGGIIIEDPNVVMTSLAGATAGGMIGIYLSFSLELPPKFLKGTLIGLMITGSLIGSCINDLYPKINK